ncbi:hypothetical protein PIB30_019523 [Stylosanthes scabra]|uniref:Uncharacterized protein n=1 Tax=Stylosanthes scabra TaxID=79078 RepID=A0ABU6V6F5_9FABA|nr:hypothetical protein [Stylosanthes scabra]
MDIEETTFLDSSLSQTPVSPHQGHEDTYRYCNRTSASSYFSLRLTTHKMHSRRRLPLERCRQGGSDHSTHEPLTRLPHLLRDFSILPYEKHATTTSPPTVHIIDVPR